MYIISHSSCDECKINYVVMNAYGKSIMWWYMYVLTWLVSHVVMYLYGKSIIGDVFYGKSLMLKCLCTFNQSSYNFCV